MTIEKMEELSKIYGCLLTNKYGNYSLCSSDERNWFAKLTESDMSLRIVLGWHLDGFEDIVGCSFEHVGTDEEAAEIIGQSVREYKNVLVERKKKEMEKDF